MIAVAILAAGRGTRMKSSLPKVIHSLGGRSLVERVLQSLTLISPTRRLVIVGYQAEQVKATMQSDLAWSLLNRLSNWEQDMQSNN
jgi:bifunctional UDP-N-acetylglucosamine pyrophosphorylase/glucosamine-1-phosphate N-acetyltransferase